MPLYRVKTEKEFLEEYGENWRFEVGFCLSHRMDYLCGYKFNATQNKDMTRQGYIGVIHERNRWLIRMKAVKWLSFKEAEELTEELNPRFEVIELQEKEEETNTRFKNIEWE